MQQYVYQYYSDEKNFASPVIIFAILYMIVGSVIYFKFGTNPVSRGLGTGLLISTFLFFALAFSNIYLNGKKLKSLASTRFQTEEVIQKSEMQRMEKVMNVTFKFAFVAFALIMAIGICVFMLTKNYYWKGIALSIMIFAFMGFLADSYNMQRNGKYLELITNYQLK